MAGPLPRDPESVYRVVRLVSEHSAGWEEAAAAAVIEAAKTIPDLRVAVVRDRAAVVREDGITYRVALELSYRIDRQRRTPSGSVAQVRRYLVVANRTVGHAALTNALRTRIKAGLAEFHVLVPATPSRDVLRLAALSVDPMTGAVIADLPSMAANAEDPRVEAQDRLQRQIAEIQGLGGHVTGEIGSADPIEAIATVLDRASFDEIVLSTLPAKGSRWLKMDLPTRVERRFGLPVVVVESNQTT